MGSLDNLPVEVTLRIISYLTSHRDVSALSLQCCSIHAMCDMKNRRRYRRIRLREDADLERGFTILRSLLRNPQLGHHIRHIEVCRRPRAYEDYQETPFERTLVEDDMTRLRTAVKKAGFVGQDEEQVVNMLMQRTPYLAANPFDMYTSRDSYMVQALAALIISFSPNLESLRLGRLGRYMSDYEIQMFRQAGQEAHRIHLPLERLFARANSGKSTTFLQNLRKVHFIDEGEDDDGRYYHDHDLFLSICYVHNLPAINSISVAYMCLDPENGRQEFPVSSSNIRDIEIIHSNVESKHLAVLISATKRLEQFTYATGGRCYLNRGKARFDPRTIIKALLLHRESLEVLDLDVDSQISFYHLPRFPPDFEDMADWDENIGEDNWDTERKRTHAAVRKLIAPHTGSLRDFVAMTDLSVGIKSLILMARGVDASNDDHDTFTLADCLPPNLESLCIRGYEKGVYLADDGHIDALIAQIQDGKLPLLKEVTGVEECIPDAESVNNPDEDLDLLYEDEEEEWSEHEY